jgi:hypothetical protein
VQRFIQRNLALAKVEGWPKRTLKIPFVFCHHPCSPSANALVRSVDANVKTNGEAVEVWRGPEPQGLDGMFIFERARLNRTLIAPELGKFLNNFH